MSVSIRPITQDDLAQLWDWRNSLKPGVETTGDPPSWNDHVAWYENRKHRLDYVIIVDSKYSVGTVAASHLDATPFVGIHVAEGKGQGIGKAAMTQLLNHLWSLSYPDCFAEIHYSNVASQVFFHSLGFDPYVNDRGDWQLWRRILWAS